MMCYTEVLEYPMRLLTDEPSAEPTSPVQSTSSTPLLRQAKNASCRSLKTYSLSLIWSLLLEKGWMTIVFILTHGTYLRWT